MTAGDLPVVFHPPRLVIEAPAVLPMATEIFQTEFPCANWFLNCFRVSVAIEVSLLPVIIPAGKVRRVRNSADIPLDKEGGN